RVHACPPASTLSPYTTLFRSRSTAGAILAQAWGDRFAILDGNVKRVLCRYHGVEGWPGLPKVEKALWEIAQSQLPSRRLADYTQDRKSTRLNSSHVKISYAVS